MRGRLPRDRSAREVVLDPDSELLSEALRFTQGGRVRAPNGAVSAPAVLLHHLADVHPVGRLVPRVLTAGDVEASAGGDDPDDV